MRNIGQLKVNFINFSDPKGHKYFLLIGGEFILKQDATDKILQSLANDGFTEKVTISQDELDTIQEVVSRNIGGSLFLENLIIHIKHTSGKFPEKIKSLLEDEQIFKSLNIALIIESSIEKVPASGTWIGNFDSFGLIINCSKLKVMEEKIWLKRKLDFLPNDLLPIFGGSIFQNNEANLLGQKMKLPCLNSYF